MHLIAPTGRKRKWDFRIRNHDGRIVRIPGDRDKNAAKRLGMKVEALIHAKTNGEPPPKELSDWIANMPPALAQRLTALGLLGHQVIERLKPLAEQIDDFERVVASRGEGRDKHAREQAGRVRRVATGLHAVSLAAFTDDAVQRWVHQSLKTVATRHHYIVALKDFCKWMKKTHRAAENPLENLKAPDQYSDPAIERCPLTVEQFCKLMAYLTTLKRHPHQRASWTAADRRLIYWTAVKTAFRQKELRSRRCGNVRLGQVPPVITIKAAESKNGKDASVPIPTELATALRKHIGKRGPAEPLFWMPKSNHTIVETLRHDLEGAGIPWQLDTGEIVDFHTLRSTAITWWLIEDRRPPKEVQVLARLKTLSMLDKYTRNYHLQEFGWIDEGPRLTTGARPAAKRDRPQQKHSDGRRHGGRVVGKVA